MKEINPYEPPAVCAPANLTTAKCRASLAAAIVLVPIAACIAGCIGCSVGSAIGQATPFFGWYALVGFIACGAIAGFKTWQYLRLPLQPSSGKDVPPDE